MRMARESLSSSCSRGFAPSLKGTTGASQAACRHGTERWGQPAAKQVGGIRHRHSLGAHTERVASHHRHSEGNPDGDTTHRERMLQPQRGQPRGGWPLVDRIGERECIGASI